MEIPYRGAEMTSARKMLIPAIVFSSTMIVFLTRALYSPDQKVQASSDDSSAGQVLSAEPDGVLDPPNEESTGCSISSGYPDTVLQWCEPIERSAHYYGVDPNLVAAVMLQESGGDPAAYSKSGAVGLMQVMPRDGLAKDFICINGPCFASRPTVEELLEPHFNIDYGISLLSGLISRYGDVREALSAYGPMNVGYSYADTVLAIYARY